MYWTLIYKDFRPFLIMYNIQLISYLLKTSRLCVTQCLCVCNAYDLVRGRALLRCIVYCVYMLFNTRNVHVLNIRAFLFEMVEWY
jgi:hypothetical protein